ncbi:dihydrofolate reductase family protein [Microtetraspora glauca]|uniref:Dihydrofolate reductase family protein n=1 Tax=Microtetraspora glauca TaxID=1996 RepID=A0ABV3GSF5_MICGL
MRKIVAGLFISLDGVVEAPDQWHFPYFSDEMGEAVGGQMADTDTMLLGRHTYEAFAEYWPHQNSDVPPADFMNGVQKVVVSTTLDKATWEPTTIIGGDVNAQLTALKAQPGKNISITGSPTLVRTLLRDGLLDELRLLVHPIVVGHGQRLFDETAESIGLALVSSRTITNGVLELVYTPAPIPAPQSPEA